jgi:holo-[acyl-carrier protein] synthase
MIVGIGVDVVEIQRFRTSAERTKGFVERLLTVRERHHTDGSPRSDASMAARFAAKEALAKALGAPAGLEWHDAEVRVDAGGKPSLVLRGSVLETATELGVTDWHVSLTHDGGLAIAYVVAERRE